MHIETGKPLVLSHCNIRTSIVQNKKTKDKQEYHRWVLCFIVFHCVSYVFHLSSTSMMSAHIVHWIDWPISSSADELAASEFRFPVHLASLGSDSFLASNRDTGVELEPLNPSNPMAPI